VNQESPRVHAGECQQEKDVTAALEELEQLEQGDEL